MAASRTGPPEEGVPPTVIAYANDLHADTVASLLGSFHLPTGGLDGSRTLHGNQYKQLLFTSLALDLAGVQLPEDASVHDRARGVVEALRRIATTPALFESVTGATYSPGLARGLTPSRPGHFMAFLIRQFAGEHRSAPSPEEAKHAERRAAEQLRATIRSQGYFEQADIPGGRAVRLEYAAPPRRRRLRADIPAQAISLLVKPAPDMEWRVQAYKSWSYEHGFRRPAERRTIPLNGLFTFLSLASEAPDTAAYAQLSGLRGEAVKLDRIICGQPLEVYCDFTHPVKIAPERPGDIWQRAVGVPEATLRQAYLGESAEFPLFSYPFAS